MVKRRGGGRKVAEPGLILKLELRRCVFEKDTLSLFSIGVKQSTRCVGPD